jgi:type VI secretion system ImpM family protein
MIQGFNTKRMNDQSIGFFGKLPAFADFIKFNAGGKEILVIDNWIQEGLALAKIKYKNEWKSHYNKCPNINFIYPFTGTDNITLGVISPTNDKSGRSYPFIMFINTIKSITAEMQYYLFPLAFEKIYTSFNDIIELNNSIDDLADLKTVTGSTKILKPDSSLVNNEYQKILKEKSLSDLINIHGESIVRPIDLFRNKINLLDNLCVFHFILNPNERLNSFLIAYCTQLMLRLFKVMNSIPGIFWIQKENNSGYLFLSITKPSPKDFIDLIFYESIIGTEPNFANQSGSKDSDLLNSIFQNDAYVDVSISLYDFIYSKDNYIY